MKKITRRILLSCATLFALVSLSAQTPDARQSQARDLLNSGVSAFKNGNPQLAIDSFIRALQLDPEFTTAELYLGQTYASMFTPQNVEIGQKAVESFERVLQKQPDNAEALARLAALYHSLNPTRARELYLRMAKTSPQSATNFYSVGAVDWLLTMNKTNPPPEGEKRLLIDEGLQNLDIALNLNPQYEDAMVYKNLLLRQKAELAADPAERASLLREADSLFARSLELRRQNQAATPAPAAGLGAAPPPPPPPPAQRSVPAGAVRIGGNVAQSNLVSNVAPVYPPLARAARVQGVVLLQTSIDRSGQVADISVLSGHPLLNEAAIEAVRQWRYQPILLNGQPVDVVTTVTVNFTMQ